MWHVRRYPGAARSDLMDNLEELLHSTTRTIMALTIGFFSICAIVLSGNSPPDLMIRLMGLAAILGLAIWLGYYLLTTHYILAQIIWQAVLLAGIVFAIWLLDEPGIALFAGLVPLISVVTIGTHGGIVAFAVVSGIAWWLSQAAGVPDITLGQAWLMVGLGAFAGLVGWASTNPLLTAAEWSLTSFDEARKHLEEAREQRLILKQTQEDLMQANRELAALSGRLKVLQRAADEARQAKAEFVANVSHELRTPLNLIIGFTEMISRYPQVYGGKLPPALMTDLGAIQRNSQHLGNLVNDVLDLSQVEAGRMAISRDWTSMAGLVQAAVAVVSGLFESKRLYLTTDLAADVPDVFCDATRIRQVIINLLSNAGRFTERGGVEVKCWREGREVMVSVTDTGPGIPEKDQKRVFEPFQQVDGSLRRQHSGSGLGLTISKQFVTMHGGNMWLLSPVTEGREGQQPGSGTTIGFSLPLEESAAEPGTEQGYRRSLVPGDEAGWRIRTRPARLQASRPAQRIVVVEEEQTLQHLLKRYLPDADVSAAPNLQSAVEDLSRYPAQLLVLNQSPFEELPAPLLRDLPFGTPAITCWVPGEIEAARRLGVVQYLVKPVTHRKLLETMDRYGPNIKTVLVADDEPDELHLFARMLDSEARGYRILQVTNGHRALSMLRSRRPDIMLLDLAMPGMDGYQVLAEKGRDPAIRDIPVVVISARDPAGDPMLSNTITITQSGELSIGNLIRCMQATAEIFSPPGEASTASPTGEPGSRGTAST